MKLLKIFVYAQVGILECDLVLEALKFTLWFRKKICIFVYDSAFVP